MKPMHLFSAIVLAAGMTACVGEQVKDYNITPVPFNQVQVSDAFWSPRIRINREVSIPIILAHCEETGRIDNFKIAGGLMEGEFSSVSPSSDTNVSKLIEGAAYSLATHPDPELEAYMDTLIHYYALAQEDDGYLYTYRTIMGNGPHPWVGSKRWEKTHELSHELYNQGHLYEAGVAYYQATGKRELLDVALKSAELVCRDFGWDALRSYPGHQEIEIGLSKLYRITGEQKYLNQAKFFLDMRGNAEWEGSTYDQSHMPVLEQDEAVGHSVRALYMFTGMADVAALTGDHSYIEASERLWNDIVKTKLYITGGVGAAGGHEGFGAKYELPNRSAYCETCAAIANVFWNHRLFLMNGDAAYIDVLERALYNNVLSGVSVDGDLFFYPNRLESARGDARGAWFSFPCCPTNICRLIPAVPGYIYAVKDKELYVNLYIGGSTEQTIGSQKVKLDMQTSMPWQGGTEIVVTPEKKSTFTVKLRIPGWARNEAVPGNELYWFADRSDSRTVVKVNGEEVPTDVLDKGYLGIERRWAAGDRITVEFPMETRMVECNPLVETNVGKMALQRGPIVYCSEGVDFEQPDILSLLLDRNGSFGAVAETNRMGDMVVLTGKANRTEKQTDGSVAVAGEVDFKAIPYYAWAHRGRTPMVMWYPVDKDVAQQ